jgi:DNA-binding response OmpR family regulator
MLDNPSFLASALSEQDSPVRKRTVAVLDLDVGNRRVEVEADKPIGLTIAQSTVLLGLALTNGKPVSGRHLEVLAQEAYKRKRWFESSVKYHVYHLRKKLEEVAKRSIPERSGDIIENVRGLNSYRLASGVDVLVNSRPATESLSSFPSFFIHYYKNPEW